MDEDDKQSFTLPEQDKNLIRELIIDAIVASPEAVRFVLIGYEELVVPEVISDYIMFI